MFIVIGKFKIGNDMKLEMLNKNLCCLIYRFKKNKVKVKEEFYS